MRHHCPQQRNKHEPIGKANKKPCRRIKSTKMFFINTYSVWCILKKGHNLQGLYLPSHSSAVFTLQYFPHPQLLCYNLRALFQVLSTVDLKSKCITSFFHTDTYAQPLLPHLTSASQHCLNNTTSMSYCYSALGRPQRKLVNSQSAQAPFNYFPVCYLLFPWLTIFKTPEIPFNLKIFTWALPHLLFL